MVELGTGLLDGVIRVSLPKKLAFELRFKWRDSSSAELWTVSGRGNGKVKTPPTPIAGGSLRGWRDEKKAAGLWTERAEECMEEVTLDWAARVSAGQLRPGEQSS